MTWLAWRQFRAQAVTSAAALAVLALVLVATGPALRDRFASGVTDCATNPGSCLALRQEFLSTYSTAWYASIVIVLAVPAVVGIFWGAPLVSREIESGTYSVAWNQSITPGRWLLVKIGVIAVAAMLTAGLCAAAVTWWADPVDAAATGQLSRVEPLLFAARGIAPIGYAFFAFTLGVAVGIVVRRTLAAMAITLAAFAVVQLAVPMLIRPYVVEPVHVNVEINDKNEQGFRIERVGTDRVNVHPADTGAWFISSGIVGPTGAPAESIPVSESGACVVRQQDREACLAEMNDLGYRLAVTYQPADRFWILQWIELGIFSAAGLALIGFSHQRIRRAP